MKPMFFILFLFMTSSVCAKEIEGYWRTYDLHAKPRSIVKFYLVNDEYRADIVQPVAQTETDCADYTQKNTAALNNKTTIIRGLKKEADNKWTHGTVLDTDSGRTYNCMIKLSEDGTVMFFHAYIKIPLFGKTVHWQRLNSLS